MNEISRRLLIAAVIISFAASVGLTFAERNQQVASRQYLLAQSLGENDCGNSICEYQSDEAVSCPVDCAKMTLDPTSGIPQSGPLILVTGVPVNPDDRAIQWWAVFADGSESQFPGQPSLDPDGSAKNAYIVPEGVQPQQLRIELRSGDGTRVIAYAWFTVLPVENNGFCGDSMCRPEMGEDPTTCPIDCSGSGGGQCTDSDVETICSFYRDIPLPDCISALDSQRDSLEIACSTVRDFCGSYGDPVLCNNQYMQCLGSGLCSGAGQNSCGDLVCNVESGENTDICPGDCGCLNCSATADDVFELITDDQGNDIFFDEYYQQQCAAGVDPIISCQMTKEKCLMDHPRYGNYDPLKCDDGYRHCVEQSTLQCGGGNGEVCGNGLCEPGESPDTCSADCHGSGEGKCGDGICGPDETSATCPLDCKSLDTDGDGIFDQEDHCPALFGKSVYFGCPVADKITVDLHHVHVAGGSSTKDPLPGVEVRVFDRNNDDFRTIAGSKNPEGSQYGVVFESDMGRVGSCVTNPEGFCIAGEPAIGDYLVIAKFVDSETDMTVYVGRPKSPGDFVDTDEDGSGDLATKDLQILKVYKKGVFQEYRGGSKVVVTGSMLEMILPESAVWDGTSSLYPFVFTSDSTWTVDVCAEVPYGYEIQGYYDENGNYVASQDCFKTFISGETKVIGFQVLETSSPEPKFTGSVRVKGPNGKKHTQKFDVSDIRKASFKDGLIKGFEKAKEIKKGRGVVFAADAVISNQVHAAAGKNSLNIVWIVVGAALLMSGVYFYRHNLRK